jgi:hypothetical protein
MALHAYHLQVCRTRVGKPSDAERDAMAALSPQIVVQAARQAGYQVGLVEHLRANRWLLTLTDTTGATVVLLVQARPLIVAADVLDLAEIVRVRRPARGILWAYAGHFSPDAQRTLIELTDHRLQIWTRLPPAAEPMSGTAWQGKSALEPNQ